jgi:hypothetical protein
MREDSGRPSADYADSADYTDPDTLASARVLTNQEFQKRLSICGICVICGLLL